MSTNYTPGPWHAVMRMVETPGDKADICTCDPELFGQGDLGRSLEEAMANARLISAAPDLLAALIDLKHLLIAPDKHLPHYRAQCEIAIRDAEAAIAKAGSRW